VQPHHILYRSQGGTDDPENVASIGGFCHLGGIHAGLIRAEGTASQMRWLIGNPPILSVSGRHATKW
jgi:hypothetical protein